MENNIKVLNLLVHAISTMAYHMPDGEDKTQIEETVDEVQREIYKTKKDEQADESLKKFEEKAFLFGFIKEAKEKLGLSPQTVFELIKIANEKTQ